MKPSLPTILLILTPLILTQQPATQTPEGLPPLIWYQCKQSGQRCIPINGAITMDANRRPVRNGQLEGISRSQYQTHFGVITKESSVRMNFKTGSNIGSAFYLISANNSTKTYQIFHLRGMEFTFDLDISKVPCAMNAALYLVSMKADGSGISTDPNKNHTGAIYGTGYCDLQCLRGLCCHEMDLWEGNSAATALTAHPCTTNGSCTIWGCQYNPYSSDPNFYGPGKAVDTKKVFTVITQFITNDGTPNGDLIEIRRLYVQNGKIIGRTHNDTNSINENFCGTENDFTLYGGLKRIGEALHDGMVLTFALFQDTVDDMRWLDTGNNGSCTTEHVDLVAKYPDAYVIFSNIRIGPIGSTYLLH